MSFGSPLEIPWMLEHGLLIRQSLRNRCAAAIRSGDSSHPLEVLPHMLQVAAEVCSRRMAILLSPRPCRPFPRASLRPLFANAPARNSSFYVGGAGAETGRMGAIPPTRLSPVGMVETNRWPCPSAARLSAGEGVFLCSVLMAVFSLPVIMACEQTRRVNCSRTVAALQATQHSIVRTPRCSTRFALRLAQGARQNAVQETWRLVPAAEKSGPLQRRRFPWRPTEHMMRSLGKKLAWRRQWIVQQTPRVSFAFARGAVAAAISTTTLTREIRPSNGLPNES